MPFFLTVTFPVVLLIFDLAFLFWFMKIPKTYTGEKYARAALVRLHTTVWGSAVIGGFYAIWSVHLFTFGGDDLRGLVGLFAAITTFGAALCLMHLRSAALTLVTFTLAPITIFLWLSNNGFYMVAALNIASVGIIFSIVLSGYAKEFARMVRQQALVEKQKARAEALCVKNFALANKDSLTGLANRRSFFERA